MESCRCTGWSSCIESALSSLIWLVREFGASDGVENGLLLGGNVGGEGLLAAVDGDGR